MYAVISHSKPSDRVCVLFSCMYLISVADWLHKSILSFSSLKVVLLLKSSKTKRS